MPDKPEITTSEIRDYLSQIQGEKVSLTALRKEFNIIPGSKSFDAVRNILFQLAEQKVVRATSQAGVYKVITRVEPVVVFNDRERRPPYKLMFPKDCETDMEMDFAQYVTLREGDLITIGGVKSAGKTTFCLNLCGENIDKQPILMGNEYTSLVEDKYEPSPRLLNRLDFMEWVDWVDADGHDKFTLLPVHDDYAEHIVKNKLNIIDWVDVAGDFFMIGHILHGIKKPLGKGIAVVALQKGEGTGNPRGGQMVRDYSDLEILLDSFGEDPNDVLLTIKGCKEKTAAIVGKTYAYSIDKGVAIHHFREVKRCPQCHANGWIKGEKCSECAGAKFINV